MTPEFAAAASKTLLEVAHAAHRMGVGQDYVRELLRAGTLKGVKLGRRWRIDPVDLEAYIDRHRTGETDRRRTAAPDDADVPLPFEKSAF